MNGLFDWGCHHHKLLTTMAALGVESLLILEPICERNSVTLFILNFSRMSLESYSAGGLGEIAPYTVTLLRH